MKTHPLIAQMRTEPLDPGQIVSGNPEVSEMTLVENPDGSTSGLWQLTPGVVTDTEVTESFMVISGKGTLAFEDGSKIDLLPGTIHRFGGGEKTTWDIEETLLKAYWIS